MRFRTIASSDFARNANGYEFGFRKVDHRLFELSRIENGGEIDGHLLDVRLKLSALPPGPNYEVSGCDCLVFDGERNRVIYLCQPVI